MLRIVFWGSTDISARVFSLLLDNPDLVSVVGVITVPDKSVGRSQTLAANPVTQLAQTHSIPIIQPPKCDDSVRAFLHDIQPDISLVVSYAKIIPADIIDIPRHKSVNVHFSLLPDLRGASPIESALLRGFTRSGVTIMLMSAGLDEGDIISQYPFDISVDDTRRDLFDASIKICEEHLLPDMASYVLGGIVPTTQDHSLATHVRKFTTEDGLIDAQNMEALAAHNTIRALAENPGTYFVSEGKKYKVYMSKLASDLELPELPAPGTLFVYSKRLFVMMKDAPLELLQIQPESKKVMDASSFINGYRHLIQSL